MLAVVTLVSALFVASPFAKVGRTVFEGNRQTALGVEVDEFLGIKYGQARRFQPPTMAYPRRRYESAQTLGNTCPGSGPSPGFRNVTTSEDCLFLNIWRSASVKPGQKVPVLVYIHEGTYRTSNGHNLYGVPMVAGSEQPMILVGINYRLNVFGFLGSSNLRSRGGSTGNWGLQDQRMALRWIRRYIRFFGGDNRRVTVYGNSAGGGSVLNQLIMPKSRGLMQQAILESTFFGSKTMEQADAQYAKVLNLTGCTDAHCLRCLPVEELSVAALGLIDEAGTGWEPTVDGTELTKYQWQAVEAGEFDTNVRVMLGSTSDEAAAYATDLFQSTDPALFAFIMSGSVTNFTLLPQLEALYNTAREYPENRGPFADIVWKTIAASTDSLFTCTTRRTTKWFAHYSKQPVYYFMASHPIKSRTRFFLGNPQQVFVPHTATLPLFWNCPRFPDLWDCDTWDQSFEATLALEMSRLYTRFVTGGAPGGEWTESYSLDTDRIFMMGTPEEVGGPGFHYRTQLNKDVCEFWDTQISISD